MGIGYQREELAPFKPSKYVPKRYTWFINSLGYIGYIITILFVLYALAILIFPDLRGKYLGDALAALNSAVILYFLSNYLITTFGVKFFYISENAFVFDSPLKSPFAIAKDEIIHVSVKRPNPKLGLLPLASPSIQIATYDKLYSFRTARWVNEQELLEAFDELSLAVHDNFAEYYHKSKNTLYSFFIRISQDTIGIIGLTFIVIYVFLALWGAIAMMSEDINDATPYTLFFRNPNYLNGDLPDYDHGNARYHPPNSDFWFGTDWIGRDIFSRLIFGTTFTFLIAIVGSFVSISIVIGLGVSSGFYGGWWDASVTRVADALLTFPPFIPLILISTIATPIRLGIEGGYYLAVFTGMSIFTWPLGARIIRSEVLEILNNEYVLAAKQIGATNGYILRTHILPKIVPTILVLFTYTFADIILGTTLLGFIGLDSESTLTWGSDLNKAVDYGQGGIQVFQQNWWAILFPTLWIFFLVFGLHLFSDSIRDILDPRLRGGLKAVPYEMLKELEAYK